MFYVVIKIGAFLGSQKIFDCWFDILASEAHNVAQNGLPHLKGFFCMSTYLYDDGIVALNPSP